MRSCGAIEHGKYFQIVNFLKQEKPLAMDQFVMPTPISVRLLHQSGSPADALKPQLT